MTNLVNVEIIHIFNREDGELMATISYQNPDVKDLNNGYDTMDVPVRMREIQKSAYGNPLVNQSLTPKPLDAVSSK